MIPGSTHSHTLFPKRKATFKKITEFALAARGFQLFCENQGKISEYTEITVMNTLCNWIRFLFLVGLGI